MVSEFKQHLEKHSQKSLGDKFLTKRALKVAVNKAFEAPVYNLLIFIADGAGNDAVAPESVRGGGCTQPKGGGTESL